MFDYEGPYIVVETWLFSDEMRWVYTRMCFAIGEV